MHYSVTDEVDYSSKDKTHMLLRIALSTHCALKWFALCVERIRKVCTLQSWCEAKKGCLGRGFRSFAQTLRSVKMTAALHAAQDAAGDRETGWP